MIDGEENKKKSSGVIILIIGGIYLLSLFAAIKILFVKKSPLSGTQTPTPTVGKSIPVKIPSVSAGGDTVSIVEIYGPIRMSSRISRGSANPDRITRKLRSLASRPEVKAVVLRINSPGGTVAAVQEIYDEVMNLRRAGKVVVASMGDVAASGGYYIAAAADRIVANPGTLTGSIGVIMEVAQGEALFKKIGVKIETVKSGKYKDTGSWSRELSAEERQVLQSLINDAYSQFVQAIEQGRKIPREKILSFADGRIFTGAQAKALGIVDELGNKTDAIYLAASLAGIKGEPKVVVEREPWEEFLQGFDLMQSESGVFKYLPISNLVGGVQMPIRFEYSIE